MPSPLEAIGKCQLQAQLHPLYVAVAEETAVPEVRLSQRPGSALVSVHLTQDRLGVSSLFIKRLLRGEVHPFGLCSPFL